MMRQYGELKRRFPDYLLLFRLGDFYELFNDDAHVASRLLADHPDVAAEGRGRDPDGGHPAPRRRRLHRPPHPRGPEGRGVRAARGAGQGPARSSAATWCASITPGTITDTQFLDGARNNFLLARARDVLRGGGRAGGRLHRRLLGGRGAGRGRRAAGDRAAAPPRRDPARPERGARVGGALGAARHPGDARGRRRLRGARRPRGARGPLPGREPRRARGGRAHRGAAGRGRGGGLRARDPGRLAGPSDPGAAPGHRRGHAARPDRGGARSSCSRRPRSGTAKRLALRHARLHQHPHGRPAAPPVDAAAPAGPGGHPPPPGGRGGPRGGSRSPGGPAAAARRGGGPRAAHQSRRPRGGPRARPDRAAELPGPPAGARGGAGRPRHPAPGDARGGDHAAARPSETT